MAAPSPTFGRSDQVFRITTVMVLAWIVLRAVRGLPQVWQTFVGADNDDMMRLMSVRAWLGGQSWFDMTQYRMVPPEGLSMHWSRLVDLGIATILWPLSKVLPMDLAERLTLEIWPALLLGLMVILVGAGTRRSLGAWAGIPAMLTLMLWLPIGTLTFMVVRIDHHNVQILMMTILAFALIDQRGSWLRGGIAGAASAFSLAVGLETMPVIGAAAIMMALPSAFQRKAWGKDDQVLAGFCLGLAGFSPLLFAAQTAPSAWFVPHCDALASPTLALVFISALACLVPMVALPSRMRTPFWRIASTLALVALGVFGAKGLLGPCLAGPYGALPPELQQMMAAKISEMQPGLGLLDHRPLSYLTVVLPDVIASLGGTVLWLIRRRSMPADRASAVGRMLVFGWLGFLGSFSQIRAITFGANAVPYLAGFVLTEIGHWHGQRRGLAAKALLAATMALATAGLLTAQLAARAGLSTGHALFGNMVALQTDAPGWDNSCRDPASLQQLDMLPASRILTTVDIGAPLILMTHHYGLTSFYHRSAAALWNGIFPFRTEANMMTAIRNSQPDYVALCRAASYPADNVYARDLLGGAAPPWLLPLADGPAAWLVLKVVPQALPPGP